MRFINYHRSQPPYDLFMDVTDMPVPGPEEVLIQVRAFGVNRADLLQRKGQYPPPANASSILGLECSGVVSGLGANVKRWKVGDEVCGLVDGGAYAEYCTLDAGMIWEKPDSMTWEEAAAIPEAYLTAFQAMFVLMDVSKMEHILIHAAASGVGSASVQLLHNMQIRKWGTASGEKRAYCLDLGYDDVIDYKKHSFREKILSWTDGGGVNGIIDFIGAPYFQENLQSLSLDGRLVMLGMLGGVRLESANILPIITRRLTVQGSTLRARDRRYKRHLVSEFVARFGGKLNSGAIKPNLYTVLDWKDTSLAHELLTSNTSRGKVVLVIPREV